MLQHQPGITFNRIAISRLNPQALPPEQTLTDRLLRWMEKAFMRGADAVMIRETLDTPRWHALLDAVERRYPAREFPLILNGYYAADDRVQGYHFRENFFSIPERFNTHHLLGKSVHSLAAARQAQDEAYDYLIYSPVFATDTHPGEIPKGLESLRQVCEGVTLPVFALGGIVDGNEAMCIQCGAMGTAAIGRFGLD